MHFSTGNVQPRIHRSAVEETASEYSCRSCPSTAHADNKSENGGKNSVLLRVSNSSGDKMNSEQRSTTDVDIEEHGGMIHIPSRHGTAMARPLPSESRSKRYSWLPFPPGPLKLGGVEKGLPWKASQVAVAPSPPRDKTYEIRVQHLNYKLPPRKQTRFSSLLQIFQGRSSDHADPRHVERYILRNISFEAKPGELLAIAGPSGAGKSTLLEVLAGRTKPTGPSGCVLINNQKVDVGQFQRVSGYVMQDDSLFPTLTVMETLVFSARLRLPAAVPTAEKMARVQVVLQELGLLHVAHTRIGNERIRGVSGGERRRVSIGVDVIHNPAVLILDEPTSGLDSAAAMNIVEMLRSMAESHCRTVILSIHQPSIRILQLMHSVLLLAEGMVVHHGSLEFLAFRLEAAGHEIPAEVNVLEYAIDAINLWEDESIASKLCIGAESKRHSLQDFFLHDQPYHSQSFQDPEKDLTNAGHISADPDERASGEEVAYANSGMQEVMVLAQRFFMNISRSKELFSARSVQACLAGLALGTIFYNVGRSSAGVESRLGFLAFTLTFFLSGTTEGLPIFLQERQILLRETSRGAYRISSYVLSNTIVFAPFLLAMGILYTIPVYWLVGMYQSTSAFGFFGLVLWLVLLMANSFVSFFSAMVPNFIMGNSLIAACMGAFFLFSGFFISKDKIPVYWLFMHYISLFKYPFDALLINEYEDQLDACFGYVDATGVCRLTGAEALHSAGVSQHSKWIDVAVMLAFIVLYRLLSYFIICFRVSRRRR